MKQIINTEILFFFHAQVFWFIPPTADNLQVYTNWTLSAKQGETFLGDLVKNCRRITLDAGHTFFIPSGLCTFTSLFASFTLEFDSLFVVFCSLNGWISNKVDVTSMKNIVVEI